MNNPTRAILLLGSAVVVLSSLVRVSLEARTSADEQPKSSNESHFPASVRYANPKCEFRGTASCSATACHGGKNGRETFGSEYTTWAEYDPHSRAFETLFSPEARLIVKNYRRLDRIEDSKPHKDVLCRKCHTLDVPINVPGSSEPKPILADGVGCENCHGAAQNWKAIHYLDYWDTIPSAKDRAKFGMQPTKDLAFRVRLCAECHLGNGDRNVDHDMIASGHPRLFFEYAAYDRMLPKHWNESKNYGSDFQTRAWAIGRVAGLYSRISSLAKRAERATEKNSDEPWPDFSDYSCFSCHHDLTSGWRKKRTRKGRLGVPRWSSEFDATFRYLVEQPNPFRPRSKGRELLTALGELREAIESANPDPKKVETAAAKCQPHLERWMGELQADAASAFESNRPLQRNERQSFLIGLLEPATSQEALENWEWEEALNHYLAVVASVTSINGKKPAPGFRKALAVGSRTLQFNKGYRSPKEFTPRAYSDGLQQLKMLLGAR